MKLTPVGLMHLCRNFELIKLILIILLGSECYRWLAVVQPVHSDLDFYFQKHMAHLVVKETPETSAGWSWSVLDHLHSADL